MGSHGRPRTRRLRWCWDHGVKPDSGPGQRKPDRSRGSLSDGGLQRDRAGLHEGTPRRESDLQLRRLPDSGDPDSPGRARRPLCLRRPAQHAEARRWWPRRRQTRSVQSEQASDRRPGRQPEEDRGAGRPGQPQPRGRPLRARCAVRSLRDPGLRQSQRQDDPEEPGAGREVSRHQGLTGRGGRRHRIHHGREGRRSLGRRRRHPGGPERHRHLPDRPGEGHQEPHDGQRLYRVGRGCDGTESSRPARFHQALVRQAGHQLGLPLVLLGALAVSIIGLPLIGLLVKAPWQSAWTYLTAPASRDALRLSLVCSLSATAIAVLLGVPLAWVQARLEFPGKTLLRAVTTLPMVLPPVVGGVALLFAFGRRGLVGQVLFDALGIRLPFSTAGVILAETFVAMPFLVITVEAGLRSMNVRFEEAARTLGAGRWTVFRRVTLPLIGPSLAAGAVLAWSRALGEFGATITFAGNFPGTTQTAPLAIYINLESGQLASAVILSLLLVVVSLAVLVALRGRYLGDA